jgi:hypothetical protein
MSLLDGTVPTSADSSGGDGLGDHAFLPSILAFNPTLLELLLSVILVAD